MSNMDNLFSLPHWLSSGEWSVASIATDEASSLVDPSLHDAEFIGLLEIGKHQNMLLFAQPESTNRIALLLSGVVLLRADNFCEGNIVLDVVVETGNQPNLLAMRDGLEKLHEFADIKVEQTRISVRSVIDKQIAKVQAGEFLILTIAPSYGCELVALCERMEVFVIS